MRIRVDEIPDSGRFLHFHWNEDRLNEFLVPDDPVQMELARPINVRLEIQKRPDHIHIQGTIEGALRLSCHRCLTDFVWPLNEEVDTLLLTEQTGEEEEVELEAEDLEYDFFDGEVIEIDQLVAEQIFLALPYKVLCSEMCRGLCPQCGTNLNEASCNCANETKNSPFATLEKIKKQLP